MKWSLLELGPVELVGADARGVLVASQSSPGAIRLVPVGDAFVAEDTAKPDHDERLAPAPFERTSLGKKCRLGWPNGATSIGLYDRLTGWSERFAIVLDDRGFSVIDAESDRVVRLLLPSEALRWAFGDPFATAGHVWIALKAGVLAIPTASLEALAAGSATITLVRHHPRRRSGAKLECVFLWFLQSGKAMVEIGDGTGGANEPKLTIAMPNLGLAKYTPVLLVDELYPWHYATLEVPERGERVSIADLGPTTIGGAKITSTRAKDPTGVAKAPKSSLPSRRAASDGELQRLVAAVAAHPTDDAHRAVLADLLLELGDPSAEAIAALRASTKPSPARLKAALGPLGLYLTNVEHVGGFPVEATLTRNAPDAEDHAAELEAACADFRLGLLQTLHAQKGRTSGVIYARLVGAPTATALRRVDVSEKATIDALLAAGRDQLEYLENVDFSEASWMEQLATPTFDRVTTVHTVVGLAHLQPLVNRLLKDKSGFFKRAKRHLVLGETRDRHADLLTALGAAWPKLPLSALTVGGVTIARDGTITGDDTKLVAVAKKAFTPSI